MSISRARRVVGFRVQAEFIGIKKVMAAIAVIFAATAIATDKFFLSALHAIPFVDVQRHFFIFTRRVKLIVRLASFSNPCTRRIAFRSARGFAMFILRLRTHLERVALSR